MEKWHRLDTYMVCEDSGTHRVTKAVQADSNGALVPARIEKYSRWHGRWIPGGQIAYATLKSGISRGTYRIV